MMMTVLIFIFWIGGVATGMVSSIFLLGLEDPYIFQPVKYFRREIKVRSIRIFSRLIISSKKAFRFILLLNSQNIRIASKP
jgi:hypothetical protein